MVYRIYVEKQPEFAHEAAALLADIRNVLGISSVSSLRVFNRYDVEGLDEEQFRVCVGKILSEPQLDLVYDELPAAGNVFAVEYLPGQFDQRADSAAQCVQLLLRCERPLVRSARTIRSRRRSNSFS